MEIMKRIRLARIRHQEYRRVRSELETYSSRELFTDLRLSPSEIPDIAAEAAEQRVEAFVRANPDYHRAYGWAEPKTVRFNAIGG